MKIVLIPTIGTPEVAQLAAVPNVTHTKCGGQVEIRPAPQKSVICNLNIDFDMKTPGGYCLTTPQTRREVIKRMREDSENDLFAVNSSLYFARWCRKRLAV